MLLICPAFTPTSLFVTESSTTQMAVHSPRLFVNTLPVLLHECPCPIAHRLLDFQGDRRRMAGRAGGSGDGHGAGSPGCLVVRAGTAATEQMKKHRHDA
jgi:hypothetical protein